MSRDFRYRAEPRHRSAAAARRGFAAGFLAGVLGFGLVWWVLGTRECPEPTADTSAADSRPAGDAERPATVASDPVFTYPQVLEKQEVVVPDATVAARTEPAPPPPPTPKDDRAASAAAPGGGSFVLQVAALRTAADAQALRPAWPSGICRRRSRQRRSATTPSTASASARTATSAPPRTPRPACSGPAMLA